MPDRGTRFLLTDRALRAALGQVDRGKVRYLTDHDGTRSGVTLTVKLQGRATGPRAYWLVRYTLDGRRRELSLGTYPELPLQQARERRRELARRYAAGERDLHAVVEAEEEARRRAREEAARERERRRQTLGALLEAYAEDLEARGRGKWARQVRDHLRRYLLPLAERPAHEIRAEDLVAVLARLRERGLTRTPGILRTMLHAAYQAAIRAPYDYRIHPALRGFRLERNPAAVLPPERGSRRDRTLEEAELRLVLARLEALAEGSLPARAVLAAVLLGGQRPLQLARARLEHLHGDVLVLHDRKGRRSEPRLHLVPLAGPGGAIVRRQAELAPAFGGWLFSSTGRVPLDVNSLSKVARRLSGELYAAGAIHAPFQLKDLRRSVETLLARLGVSRDVRAQLLSHGVGGIQGLHYDRHAYLDEKRAAIERLARWWREDGGVVVPFPGASP